MGLASVPGGWLRSPRFDLALIGGVLLLALGLGVAASARPGWFLAVLWADLWLLAYPHVASTWLRVAVTPAPAKGGRLALAALFPLVLGATAGVAYVGGAVALTSLYYHWQSWHYTRQSYGIARAYQRVAGVTARDWITDAVVFAFPVWGWLHRCADGASNFLGRALWLPPVPAVVATGAGLLAFGLLAIWLLGVRRARAGHAFFVLSHVVITTVSYVLVTDITRGWIFVNIWHNAQYLLFVWARNTQLGEGGEETGSGWRSVLCATNLWPAYAAAILVFSTAAYLLIDVVGELATTWVVLGALVLHLSVNFHHYVVDAFIWTRGGEPGAPGSGSQLRLPAAAPFDSDGRLEGVQAGGNRFRCSAS